MKTGIVPFFVRKMEFDAMFSPTSTQSIVYLTTQPSGICSDFSLNFNIQIPQAIVSIRLSLFYFYL